jgi:hypothetical protein
MLKDSSESIGASNISFVNVLDDSSKGRFT